MHQIQENNTLTLALTNSSSDALQDAGQQPLEPTPSRGHPRAGNDVADVDVTIQFIRNYINTQQIEVLFDGTLFFRGHPLQAVTPDEVDAVLAADLPSVADLLDELL